MEGWLDHDSDGGQVVYHNVGPELYESNFLKDTLTEGL